MDKKSTTELAYLMGRFIGLLSKEDVKEFFITEGNISEIEIDEVIGQLTHIANTFYK